MTSEISFDDTRRRAGRWAIASSIFGAFAVLIYAAFGNQLAVGLGFPSWLGFGLAWLGGIAILLLNWGISDPSKGLYGWFVAGFVVVLAVQSILMCIFAYVADGLTGQTLGVMALEAGLFLLAALPAWRLGVLAGRL